MGDGASIHTKRWLEGIALDPEWDLYLISANPAPVHPDLAKISSLKEVVKVAPRRVSAKGGNFQYAFLLPAIRREIKRIDPHVINSMYLTSYGVMSALLRGGRCLCHYVMGSDIMVTPGKSAFYKVITRWALSKASLVVSASRPMTEKLLTLDIPSDRIVTQQYGVEDWLLSTPFEAKNFDFITNRAWIANSNIVWMLEALGQVSGHPVTAVVGAPVKDFEDIAGQIERHIANHKGLCALGSLGFKENIEAVRNSRFFLSFTSSDGTSLSLLEAMAVGAVPIVSDIAANRDWIQDGVNGFLVSVGDTALAVKQLNRALSLSASEYRKIQNINRQLIREKGSLTVNMANVSKKLKALLDSAGQSTN
jgi:glycosyltransferase involved in cell wall biosynthesis